MSTARTDRSQLSTGTLWLMAPRGEHETKEKFENRRRTVNELMRMGYEHGYDVGCADGATQIVEKAYREAAEAWEARLPEHLNQCRP